MNADLILVLDKGRIVQKGSHQQLLEEPGIYRQIFDIQTRIESELQREIDGAAGGNGNGHSRDSADGDGNGSHPPEHGVRVALAED
jgi:ATP-binding cassette subfamily B protein